MDCQKASFDAWIFKGKLSSSAVCFTLSTVSWNSRPVSAKRISMRVLNHAQEEVSQDYLFHRNMKQLPVCRLFVQHSE